MKSLRLFVATLFFSVLAVPVLSMASVSAQTGGALLCAINESFEPDGCDLSVQKEVSVNGGPFFDANTSGEAVSAIIGQSVVWRISITDTSDFGDEEYFVTGIVQVGDNLPAGVTYVSSVSSDGSTYDPVNDVWQFSVNSSTSYPIQLNISTTAASAGLAQNFAFLSGNFNDEDCLPPSFFCEYSDANNENDGDQAWVDISAAPVVLAATTGTPVVLAATGSGTTQSLVAAGLIAATLLTLGYSRLSRKQN